jgi:AcrR family transcriptional regulator
MGHKHSRDEILAGALAVAFEDGLGGLTFGRVAKHLGVSDRIVVYYFPSKDDLVGDVLVAMGLQLQETLAAAFRTPADDHLDLLRRAWPVLSRDESESVFALFFEAAGLSATGREPYRTLVPQLVDAWIDWTSGFVQGTSARRRTEAEAAVVLVDGLLLLRQMAGTEAAQRAARTLGIRGRR